MKLAAGFRETPFARAEGKQRLDEPAGEVRTRGRSGRKGMLFRGRSLCRLRCEEISRATMRDSMLKHARRWIRELLQQGARLKCPKTAATYRLLRHEPSLWVFLYHNGVEPTNNAAERALGARVTVEDDQLS